MSNSLRSLMVGLFAGVALSAARAPLGLDLFSIPAVAGMDANHWRALGLVAVLLALGSRTGAAAPSVPWVAAGAALGFGAHGFFAPGCLSSSNLLLLTAALCALAFAVSRWVAPASPVDESEPDRPNRAVEVGQVIAGVGAAMTLASIARSLRLLGLGTTADDTAFAFAFLVLLAVGAISFAGLVNGPKRGRPCLAAGLALGSLAGLYSVAVLAEFSSRMGLDAYLRLPTWGLDTSYIGMLQGDLLIAGRTLLLPAFVLGAALSGARRVADLQLVLVGGALGVGFLSEFTGETAGTVEELSLLTSEHVITAVSIAALGGLIACLGELRGRAPAPILGSLICVTALIAPRVLPVQHVLPLSPWEPFPPDPQLLMDTEQGLLTVERVAGNSTVLTLDRRHLTPRSEDEAADAQRLRLSWELLSEAARDRGRVLLVGQLTPLRATVLSNLGARRIDRTAAWHTAMPAVERELFGTPVLPPGKILTPSAARELLNEGAFDLVIVPPVAGSSPVVELPPAEPAGEALVCVWIATDVHAAWRDWGERVLLSSSGLEGLHLGLTNAPGRGVPAGSPTPFGSELERLLTRPFERGTAARAAVTRRLAEAARGTESDDLLTGLALHYAAQRRSSPWETEAQRIEVDAEALAHLRAAALGHAGADGGGGPGIFLRDLWQGVAQLLIEKREIELAYQNLVPLAEAFAPWPELERALAAADLEMLDPSSAADRLLRVIESSPYDLNLRAACADALAAAGRAPEAAAQSRAALEIQPGRRDFERRLAAALVISGDPAGPARIEELLRADPDDHALEVYLESGPFEPLPPPAVGGDQHDH